MEKRPPFTVEPPLLALRDALPRVRDGQFPPYPEDGDRRQAAVSLILRHHHGVEALLIRRAEAEGDPWSGHIALPGGRRDLSDPDLPYTARRETLEETGVALDRVGVSLGFLEPLLPATRRLPPLAIYPFVFAVPDQTATSPCSREVDEVFWTPLRDLFDPRTQGTVRIQMGDGGQDFPCIRLDDRVIWGLTYRILQDFLGRITEHAPQLLEGLKPPHQTAEEG